MKSTIFILSFSLLSLVAFGQGKVDPSYSAYNYKHPNKAAYAKKHNLDNATRVGQVEVTQAENYKRGNAVTTSKKVVVVSRNDRDKKYPNYKHQIQR